MTVEGFQDLLPTTPRLLRGAITYVAGTTGAIGSTTLFTVTGDVLIYGVKAKSTTTLTSAGAPTWGLGVTGATDSLALGITFPDVTAWSSGKWADMVTPTYTPGAGTASNTANGAIGISADIVQAIAVAAITGGVVRWYAMWSPLSGDGNLTLHANLSAF